jgi:hypothetical protein
MKELRGKWFEKYSTAKQIGHRRHPKQSIQIKKKTKKEKNGVKIKKAKAKEKKSSKENFKSKEQK